MPVDLGNIIGRALENTLDAKGLTYAIQDTNEVVLKCTYVVADGKFENYEEWSSDGEYLITDAYILYVPPGGSGDAKVAIKLPDGSVKGTGDETEADLKLTLKKGTKTLIENYRIVQGLNTTYHVGNGEKITWSVDATGTTMSGTISGWTSDVDFYLHLKLLKLVAPT